MEIEEDDYILGYWFTGKANKDCWYAMVIKRHDGIWLGQFTYRSHMDDDPFSGKDKKNSYIFEVDKEKSENEVLRLFNKFFYSMKSPCDYFSDFFLVQGDIDKFMKIAKTKHYLNFREKKLND